MPAAFVGKVHVSAEAEVCVLTLRGELDYQDAEDVERAGRDAADSGLRTTVVDLSQVTFADSTLLNALLLWRRRHDADGRHLVITGPLQPAVYRLLDVSGTLEYFSIDSGDGPAANG
ncbi:STAS domain-containing protein [Actinacidiphila acidipaludis]|uniref:STAS domain-containing protein n=1 Tax=Actinacidiphila acidipaludis TaxID=2873382 RepID=A0ABS7PZN8_9ACTN|nr:STAS domain-containing protein [Streptomyces acidipaludis]MBY8876357.1 STAS domain-containing protein [Streptomyces acidipaludis]